MTEQFMNFLSHVGTAAFWALVAGLILSFVPKSRSTGGSVLVVSVWVHFMLAIAYSTFFIHAAWGTVPAIIIFFLGPIAPLVGMGVAAANFGMSAAGLILWLLALAGIAGWRASRVF